MCHSHTINVDSLRQSHYPVITSQQIHPHLSIALPHRIPRPLFVSPTTSASWLSQQQSRSSCCGSDHQMDRNLELCAGHREEDGPWSDVDG